MDVVVLFFSALAAVMACVSCAVSVALWRRFDELRREPKEAVSPTAESFHEAVMAGGGRLVEVQSAQVTPREAPEDPPTQQLSVIRTEPPFPPPMVGDETLKQWMVHSYSQDGIFARFVDAFYIRAASSHYVRPLFEGKDLNDIKKKFLATLLILLDKGVDERAAATLIKVHLPLNMTVEAYDATMAALETTLVEYRVPEDTIAQMVPMINYFRDEMVKN